MYERERCVVVSANEYADLIAAAKEAEMIRGLLQKKLARYGGIKHGELEDLCTMLGLVEEKED